MGKTIISTLISAPNVIENSGSRVSARMRRKFRTGSKRVLDVGGAFVFLVAFAPVLLGVALLLLLVQGRPILFKHKRIGRKGETFYCLKFRTMVNDASQALDAYIAANPAARKEWQASQKLKDDPRVTALGHVMRKLSIDELPQFINVVAGQMSLVGPRPIVASEVRFYGPQISYYESVRPGITGPWQVGGRSNTSYTRRVQLDVDYARNWSLGSDVVILLKTLPAVLTSSGSC
jgi:exopolysaccharide production protein ExoY